MLRLVKDPDHTPWGGGTVVYRCYTESEEWVGWIADEREWRGWGDGGRRWGACHRKQGDTAARWNSEGHRTRREAVAALIEGVARG